MRAGQLDTLVQIQSVTITQDSAGGVVQTWADLRTAWVQRRQTGGGERVESGREVAAQTVEFWGHFVDWFAIGPQRYRIKIGDDIYNITRIDLSRSKGSALIVCEQGLQLQ